MKIDKNKEREKERELFGGADEVDVDRTVLKDDGEVDYRESNKYAKALTNNKDKAVSTFARTKTIQQQKEFLPIFDIR